MGGFDPVNWVKNLSDPSDWGTGVAQAFNVNQFDPTNADRGNLQQAGAGAQQFGQGAANSYNAMTNQLGGQSQYLQGIQNGTNSVSAMQLQQAQQAAQAQQMSMAAGASANNAPMAARQAAMNSSRLNYGLAGQQAVAGLQERNQATNSLNNMYLQQRGQDEQGAIGGYGASAGAYGSAIQNPQKTGGSIVGGMVGGGAGGMASMMSDRRVKKNVAGGDVDSKQALGKLNAYKFDYKDEKHGKGRQLGVMAQDLEKAGLGHVIVERREGKAVDTGRLSLANTAMLSSLHKRLSKIEGK